MMTSSNGDNFRVTGPLCGEFTGHQLIPLINASDAQQWFFMCTWINGLVNCSEAGCLIRHRAHYDVTNVCTRIWHTPFIYLNLSPVPLILKLILCNIGNGYFIIQHRFSWIVTTHPCPKVDKFDEYLYPNALYRYNFHLCLISTLV